jgi:hypothetical protein
MILRHQSNPVSTDQSGVHHIDVANESTFSRVIYQGIPVYVVERMATYRAYVYSVCI